MDALRSVIDRDLHDAGLEGLSADRAYATAYNAALQAAKMAIGCAGYQVKGEGAHHITFQGVVLAMGPEIEDLANYFDACRRKRNQLEYDQAYIISDAEAAEVTQAAEELLEKVETWIAEKYPRFAR